MGELLLPMAHGLVAGNGLDFLKSTGVNFGVSTVQIENFAIGLWDIPRGVEVDFNAVVLGVSEVE